MEIILLIVAKIFVFASTGINIFHFYKTRQKLDDIIYTVDSLDTVVRELAKIAERTVELKEMQISNSASLIRILESLKQIQEAQNPKSKTNWDNLKEAFKGPSRITINERD